MSVILKWMPVFWVWLGISIGVFFCMVLGPTSIGLLPRLAGGFGVLLFIAFWRPVDRAIHARYVETWELHHSKGPWKFVLGHYVLLRGSFLFFAFIAPILGMSQTASSSFGITALAIVLVSAVTMWLGWVEWSGCEKEFVVRSMREVAEAARDTSAMSN
jgi:hypothetical protein